MVVLPADHIIADHESYLEVLNQAVQTAIEEEALVTIGIRPDRPETGYGYIRFNDTGSAKKERPQSYPAEEFTEKPELEKARSFLKSGNYLWNSGMFVWKADVILKAFEKYQPGIFEPLRHLRNQPVTEDDINRFYQACPSISIDYGIMEQAENVQVIPGEFGWNDAGSWKAVYELSEKDSDENAVFAQNSILHGSKKNYLKSDSGKMIALVGVENLAIVETETSLLICNLYESQEVKKVVEHLKSREELNLNG